jgi:hypothetical protein
MEIEFIVTENTLGVKIMNINDSYQSSNILCSR